MSINVMITDVIVLNTMSDFEYIAADVYVKDLATHVALSQLHAPVQAHLLTEELGLPDGSRIDEINPYDADTRIFGIKMLVPLEVAEDFRCGIYGDQADRMQAHTDLMTNPELHKNTCFCGGPAGMCDCYERLMDDDRGDSSGY